MSPLSPSLLSRILEDYSLPPNGVHGVSHWARVLENARRLSALTPGADPSVQVCWDADRLDLMRVGIRPQVSLLCTEAARVPELMQWANQRAVQFHVPELVREEWDVKL